MSQNKDEERSSFGTKELFNSSMGQQAVRKEKQRINLSEYMARGGIQRSTYTVDDDAEEQNQDKSVSLAQRKAFYLSQHLSPKKSQSIIQKKLSEQQVYHQTKNRESFSHKQHQQQYESISSQHSEERQDFEENDKKQIIDKGKMQGKKTVGKQEISLKDISEKISIHSQKGYPIKNIERFGNESRPLKQSVTINKIEDDMHATFSLVRSEKNNSGYDMEKISHKSFNDKIKNSPQVQSRLITSNSSLNQKSSKDSKPYQELKYPSIIKSTNSVKKFSGVSSIHEDDFQSSTQLKSTKNYALTMKKMTSDESPKRAESLGKSRLSNEDQKLTKSDEKKNSGVEKKKAQFQQRDYIHEKTQPNLFYVSISKQQLYPNLDLKKNALNSSKESEIKILKADGTLLHHENKNSPSMIVPRQSQQPHIESGLPCGIKISQYRSQYFLKIETQVFTLHVQYPTQSIELPTIKSPNSSAPFPQPVKKFYVIERRFSDFVFLYESVMTNHLGYIIYPFPEKSLESFVKIKLQSIITSTMADTGYEAEKMQLIEKRLEQLQKFVNFLLQHEELKYCEELSIFLCQDLELYQSSRQRIEKYIEEYRQLQSSGNLLEQGKKNIKKVIQTGYGMVMKWWSASGDNKISVESNKNHKAKQQQLQHLNPIGSSGGLSMQSQNAKQFATFSNVLDSCHSKFHLLQKLLNKLTDAYQKVIGFKDIDTQFDYLVKLCAKVSSGKEYTKHLEIGIAQELIRDVETHRRWLQQAKAQLQKRQQLLSLVDQLKSSTLSYGNGDVSAKISKLERRLQRFEKNFRFGFQQMVMRCEKTFLRVNERFKRQWQVYCKNMSKIWK